ncbi:hypothetical protein [Janthinobacterium sp. DSP2-3-3]|uniref:hypothetical protein n=1 Tax=unclassified Janthinobacterium TaxID=2610881 RepID=UPI003CEE2276
MRNDSVIDSFIVCERIAAILRRIKRQRAVNLTRLILRNAPPAEDATLNLPAWPSSASGSVFPDTFKKTQGASHGHFCRGCWLHRLPDSVPNL